MHLDKKATVHRVEDLTSLGSGVLRRKRDLFSFKRSKERFKVCSLVVIGGRLEIRSVKQSTTFSACNISAQYSHRTIINGYVQLVWRRGAQ